MLKRYFDQGFKIHFLQKKVYTKVAQVCNKCFGSVTTEESYSILTVPMASTLVEAINMHIADEYLFGDNKAFCDQCAR